MLDQLNLVNMTEQVNVQDAKTRLSELLHRVEAGEEIIIARSGKPIAKLVPERSNQKRELGVLPQLVVPDSFFEPLSEEELLLWEGGE